MLGRILGKTIAFPVRLVAAPFVWAERLADDAWGATGERATDELLDLARSIERSVEEAVDR